MIRQLQKLIQPPCKANRKLISKPLALHQSHMENTRVLKHSDFLSNLTLIFHAIIIIIIIMTTTIIIIIIISIIIIIIIMIIIIIIINAAISEFIALVALIFQLPRKTFKRSEANRFSLRLHLAWQR